MLTMRYKRNKNWNTLFRTGIHTNLNNAIQHAHNAKRKGKKYIIRKIWNGNRILYEVWTTKNKYEM